MHTPWSIAAALLFLLTPTRVPEERARDLAALQGEWVLLETADARRTDRGDDAIRMTIRDEAITLTFHGTVNNEGSIDVGGTDVRRCIDLRLDTGVSRGVYEIDGDFLTVCIDEPGKARPTTLTPTGTQWRERWKRVQP
jgi:uncharacterized protein (TIGR03067 family)